MEGPTEKVRVLRAFLHKGKRIEPSDKPIVLPKLLAIELQAAKKAVIEKEEALPAEPPQTKTPAAEPPKTETSGAAAPEPEKGSKGKGGGNAR